MILLVVHRYIFWIFFIWGCVGHPMNLYVFTRSCFRSRPTSLYFFASTIANSVLVGVFIPLRILRYGFNVDPASASLVFCKLSFFIEDCTRIIASWYLTLACIDRYCFTSSNVGLRQLSTMMRARYAIYLSAIMIFFVNLHLLVFYQIVIGQCMPLPGIYQSFLSLYRLLINFLIPTFFMCICAIFILRNIDQSRKRITPFMIGVIKNHRIIRSKRRIDQQLYRMLCTQCLLWFLANTLAFIDEIFVFIACCLTFYVFLSFSQLFRRQVAQFLKNIAP